jgi:hypothetical protein
VVRAPRTVTKVEMRSDGRIAMMGKLAGHLDDPFVPTWQMVNDDHARELADGGWARAVRLSAIAIAADGCHGFSEEGRMRHSFLTLGASDWSRERAATSTGQLPRGARPDWTSLLIRLLTSRSSAASLREQDVNILASGNLRVRRNQAVVPLAHADQLTRRRKGTP